MLTTQGQPAHENSSSMEASKSAETELAEYIGHLAHGLAKMAKRPRFETIAYLLELVVIEANGMIPNMTQIRSDRGKQQSEK